MNKEYLSVDISIEDNTVSITGNYDGLKMLKTYIDDLLDSRVKPPSDRSIMSSEWGGEEEFLNINIDANNAVHHLRIYRIE